jgi:hypothetical protein
MKATKDGGAFETIIWDYTTLKEKHSYIIYSLYKTFGELASTNDLVLNSSGFYTS